MSNECVTPVEREFNEEAKELLFKLFNRYEPQLPDGGVAKYLNELSIADKYLNYMHNIYYYRYQFYKLSENINYEICSVYAYLASDKYLPSNIGNLRPSEQQTQTFSVTIDFNAPLSTNEETFNRFCTNSLSKIRAYHKNTNEFMALRDDMAFDESRIDLCIINSPPVQPNGKLYDIRHFSDCLTAYKEFLFNSNEYGNPQDKYATCCNLGYLSGAVSENMVTTAYKKLRRNIDYALALIKSAEDGCFPETHDYPSRRELGTKSPKTLKSNKK